MYKNFRVGGGIVLGLSALVLSLAACTATIDRNSDNTIKLADETTKPYSYTFKSGDFVKAGGNVTLNNITWNQAAVADLQQDSGGRGVQFGNSTNAYKGGDLLSTNYFADKMVSKVVINAVAQKGFVGTISINGKNGISLATGGNSSALKNYEFTISETSANLAVHFDVSTGKAIFLNKIDIYYSEIASENAKNVTYHYNNGNENKVEKYDTGHTLEKPNDPTYTGYRFDGWYTDKALTTAATFPIEIGEADIDLYAKWVKTYTVTFKNDGKTYLTETVDEKTCVAKPEDPTKAADSNYEYTFAYWESNYKEFDFNTKITSDITLYAKYSQTRVSAEPLIGELKTYSNLSFDYKYEDSGVENKTAILSNGLGEIGRAHV